MNLDFASALSAINQGAGVDVAFQIANQARPAGDYLFNTILPERLKPDYGVNLQTMTVRPTMAGIVGEDSPYPESGAISTSSFLMNSAKVANQVTLPESATRELQSYLQVLSLGGGATSPAQAVAQTALNFFDKLIVQAHLDTFEYLRGKALVAGAIDWTFSKKRFQVSYGIPGANLQTNRTGTSAYYNSSSTFWADYFTALRTLNFNVRAIIAHPDMISDIISNPANQIRVTDNGPVNFSFTRFRGNTEVPSGDARERTSITAYALQGEIYDYLTGGGATTKVNFMNRNKILFVANNVPTGFTVGLGATTDPLNNLEIGYTHIAPTVEGGGRMGRWGRVFTPEHLPMKLVGQGVTNGVPVIEVPQKIYVMSSDLSF